MKTKWTSEQEELLLLDEQGFPKLKRVAVLADAGSGKTSVLVARVKGILEKRPTDKVLCVSFTEKSARDLTVRLCQWENAEVYTIHGFCAQILRQNSGFLTTRLGLSPQWRVLDGTESQSLFSECYERTFRRNPPDLEILSAGQWFQLCQDILAKTPAQRKNLKCGNVQAGSFVFQVIENYEAQKQKRSALDFQDLEVFSLVVLKEKKQEYWKRYQHIFVDEFQDTSPSQCEFVRELAGPQASLFIVGDSKQSIYGFRGADVRSFESFVETLSEKRRLSKNFRSTENIITAVNDVSASALEGFQDMSPFQERQDLGIGGIPVALRDCSEDASEAAVIFSMIVELEKKGIPVQDQVLLMPRVKGKEKLFEELKNLGVIPLVGTQSSLFREPKLRSLFSLWVGLFEPWQTLRRQEAKYGLGVSWEETFALKSSPSECLKGLNETLGLKERLGIWYEIFRAWIFKEEGKGLSSELLARKMALWFLKGIDPVGVYYVPPPQDLAQNPLQKDSSKILQVFTVHGSKGLEFPAVIIADLQGKNLIYKKPYFISDSEILICDRDEKGDLIKSERFQEYVAEEKRGALQESARLFYVAMTRAEKALYFVDDVSHKAKNGKAKEGTWASWVHEKIPRLQDSDFSEIQKPAPSNPMELKVQGPLQTRQPVVFHQGRIGVTQKLQTEKKYAKESFSMAALLGIRVHEYLEVKDLDGLFAFAAKNKINLKYFKEWLSTEEGKTLLSDSQAVKRVSEFSFEKMLSSGEILTGRIDLLLYWPEKKEAWIVDYKTFFSKKSTEDIKTQYGLQLQTYGDLVQEILDVKTVKKYVLDILASSGEVWISV